MEDRVAVEVEGEGSSSRDNEARDGFLQEKGWTVMHFTNEEALRDHAGCVDRIRSPTGETLSSLVSQMQIGIQSGRFTFKNILAKMDVRLTLQLAAAFREQLSQGSRCPVCMSVVRLGETGGRTS